MRLMVGYSEGGAAVFGILGNRAINLTARDPALGTDLGALIRAGAEGLSRIAPLLSDSEDAQASGDMRGMTSMVSAGAPIVRPRCSERLDYEAELMAIIGRRGRHIAKADALDHVFGYMLFNDASIRDYQRKTHQWTPGKNFDRSSNDIDREDERRCRRR